MQSPASIGRAVYRITFRRGSPQRIHYSPALTLSALLSFVVLAAAGQILVFGQDIVGVVLYLFTWVAGTMLALAWLSRRVPRTRLRVTQQAGWILVSLAHAVLLLTVPAAYALVWLPGAMGGLLLVAVVLGLTSCVQFALGTTRARALACTLVFAFALAGFYVTMQSLLAIAMA